MRRRRDKEEEHYRTTFLLPSADNLRPFVAFPLGLVKITTAPQGNPNSPYRRRSSSQDWSSWSREWENNNWVQRNDWQGGNWDPEPEAPEVDITDWEEIGQVPCFFFRLTFAIGGFYFLRQLFPFL